MLFIISKLTVRHCGRLQEHREALLLDVYSQGDLEHSASEK